MNIDPTASLLVDWYRRLAFGDLRFRPCPANRPISHADVRAACRLRIVPPVHSADQYEPESWPDQVNRPAHRPRPDVFDGRIWSRPLWATPSPMSHNVPSLCRRDLERRFRRPNADDRGTLIDLVM